MVILATRVTFSKAKQTRKGINEVGLLIDIMIYLHLKIMMKGYRNNSLNAIVLKLKDTQRSIQDTVETRGNIWNFGRSERKTSKHEDLRLNSYF